MPFLLTLLFILSACGKSSGGSADMKTLQGISSEYKIPALASMLIKKDAITEANFVGLRKADETTVIEPNDVFHLGSCTKAMTATLAGILIEEGKLSWDSTLNTLLPDINLHASFQGMKFQELLVHRAGLLSVDDSLFQKIRSMDSVSGKEYVLSTLLQRAPQYTPGTQYFYSNYGYIIAGRILERLTGTMFEELMTEKLFNPLGMKSCGFGPAPLVWGHLFQNDQIIPRFSDNPVTLSPAGRVHCSLNDWGKFLTAHLKGFRGENNIVSNATFKKLHSTAGTSDSSYTYGGWLLNERAWAKGKTLSHAGSNTMNFAKVWIAPEIESILMSVTNIGGSNAEAATEAAISNLITSHL